MIQVRGQYAVITVEPTDANLKKLRNIPAQGEFVGTDYKFIPCLASIEYVRHHWPKLTGLDAFATYRKMKDAHNEKKPPWSITWEPYEHQKEAFKASWNKRAFAWFMDMGTGKSALSLLNASWLAYKGYVNGVLILAPSGVHSKWIDNELAKVWPDCVPYKAAVWSSDMRKAERERVDAMIRSQDVAIMAMNIEAFSSAAGKAYKAAESFLRNHDTFMVVDESHLIKNPSASRTKSIIKLGQLADFRRILTGTPGQPLDYYSQFNFLDPKIINIRNYTAFKHEFAIMIELKTADGQTKKDRRGRPIEIVAVDRETGKKKYKNLDRLKKITAPFVFRVQKDECLDLPPKVYEWIPVKLTKEQRALYDDLSNDLIIEFEGREISATMAIQKMIRLRQVIGGYLPDIDGNGQPINAKNPRIERMLDVFEGIDHKIITWACYKAEIVGIAEALRKRFPDDQVVTYYGEDSREAKERAKAAFQEGDARFFVSNPQCGGVGLDLYASFYTAFYSNSYSLKDRQQAEDRVHRIGQTNKCIYLDCYAENTVDQRIISALIQKKEIETELNGDIIADWLKTERMD